MLYHRIAQSLILLVNFSIMALGEDSAEKKSVDGEQLARTYCGICHQFTEPDLLPKKSWNFLLTYMGMRLGIDDAKYLDNFSKAETEVLLGRKAMLEFSNLIPRQPMLSEFEWEALRDYFMSNAPDNPLAQDPNKPAITEDSSLFVEKAHRHISEKAITSLVHIDEANQQLLIGDSLARNFTILDNNLGFESDFDAQTSMWVQAAPTREGIYLLSIGDISGDYIGKRYGRVFYARRVGNMYLPQGAALSNLYRPSAMAFGDLNGDGREELVVCNFGVETGDVSIYKRESEGVAYKAEPVVTLDVAPGPVDCDLHDFNGDGLLDIAVLHSDARERFVIYLNQGHLEFDAKTIFEMHPSYGHTRFQLIDFNKDGHMDLVTANGDNVDSDPYNTRKRFHGIRIYLNDDDLNFNESFFYPLYGAFGMEVHDFDLDGDLDIAAIAFNPDFHAEQPENFVFLEQTAVLQFAAKSHPATYKGRWMTIDAGDLDKDGDADLVLGGVNVLPGWSVGYTAQLEKMTKGSQPLLFLENQTIE